MTAKEKNIINFPKRKDRKLVVDGVNWKWRFGPWKIKAYSEKGDAFEGNITTVSKLDNYTLGRGRDKRTGDASITPQQVVDWIKSIKN